MKTYCSLFLIFILTISLSAQVPDTVWTRTFGGTSYDEGNSVKQTSDDGFIIAGSTSSFGAGGRDFYLIKTDEYGNQVWTKTFGGSGSDVARVVHQTGDNGYIIMGTSDSFGSGSEDFLLWKTDSLGNTEWYQTYGDNLDDKLKDGQITSDSGYIITGGAWDNDIKTLVIKIDKNGGEEWRQIIADSTVYNHHDAASVLETNEGDYLVAGTYISPTAFFYTYKYYLKKFTGDGATVFYRAYEYDYEYYTECALLKRTNDGKYLLGGFIGIMDAHPWLIKVNSIGSMVWQTQVSGSQIPVIPSALEPTPDNGYIMTVFSVLNTSAVPDFQLLKINDSGMLDWERMLGGSLDDAAHSVALTNTGGYIVTGYTKSFGAGNADVWLMRFENPVKVLSPNGGEDWLIGEQREISWSAGNIDSVKIELRPEPNSEWITIEVSTPNDGSYDWTVEAAQTYQQCTMKISDVNNNGIFDVSDSSFVIEEPSSISDSHSLPQKAVLLQNYPNPFNPVTNIQYKIRISAYVKLQVYDMLGNEVAALVNEEKPPGTYTITFDGSRLSSGIYFYKIMAGSFIETKKLILIK